MKASRRVSIAALALIALVSAAGAVERQAAKATGVLWQFQTGG